MAVGAGSGQPVTANLVQSSYGGIDGGPTGAVVNNSGTNTRGRAPWLGRNFLTGPGFFDMDARIGRNIPIHERAQLQLRVDAFNLLNHQNVLGVNTSAFNFAAAGSGRMPRRRGRVRRLLRPEQQLPCANQHEWPSNSAPGKCSFRLG